MSKKEIVKITDTKSKIGKIEVDRDLCIGAATCVVLAPKTYDLDSENKAILKNPPGDCDQEIIDGAKSCPVLAVKIFDKKGKQIVP